VIDPTSVSISTDDARARDGLDSLVDLQPVTGHSKPGTSGKPEKNRVIRSAGDAKAIAEGRAILADTVKDPSHLYYGGMAAQQQAAKDAANKAAQDDLAALVQQRILAQAQKEPGNGITCGGSAPLGPLFANPQEPAAANGAEEDEELSDEVKDGADQRGAAAHREGERQAASAAERQRQRRPGSKPQGGSARHADDTRRRKGVPGRQGQSHPPVPRRPHHDRQA
jgi:hypothetical protein